MPPETIYEQAPDPREPAVTEQDIEEAFVQKLRDLKYTDRPDIRDRASLEANFRQKFETLNRVRLTDGEFAKLLDDLVSPDVFKNSVRLREKNDFTRDDGTPLSYTLVNIRDWCKNDFEVVHQKGQKIVLIDGARLAALMIEHGVGVSSVKTYALKRVDSDYFETE